MSSTERPANSGHVISVSEIHVAQPVHLITRQCVELMLQLIKFEQNYLPIFNNRSDGYLRGLAQRIFQENQVGLIATIDDKVVGLLLTRDDEFTHIASMVVDQEHRGIGVGSELVERFKHRYLGDSVSTRVYKDNKEAIKFYEKHGFVFQPNGDEHDIIFGKTKEV